VLKKIAQILTTAILLVGVSLAHSQSADKKVLDTWSLSLGGGVISKPDYEGSKKNIGGVIPELKASYKTADYGKFSLDPRNGLAWTPIDKDEYSLGLGLAFDFGRTDKADGTAFRPGSKRLKGMGVISSSADFNVFGHYVLGVPLYVQLTKNLGSGKLDASKKEFEGSGGTRVEIGVELPWQATKELKISLAPNVVWADKKYEQAYFGVTSTQSAASGFKLYTPKGGVKSAGINLSADYKISPDWNANVTASFNQLQGDAGKSPLVQRKGQSTLIAGVSYSF
jgi:MipA family protein